MECSEEFSTTASSAAVCTRLRAIFLADVERFLGSRRPHRQLPSEIHTREPDSIASFGCAFVPSSSQSEVNLCRHLLRCVRCQSLSTRVKWKDIFEWVVLCYMAAFGTKNWRNLAVVDHQHTAYWNEQLQLHRHTTLPQSFRARTLFATILRGVRSPLTRTDDDQINCGLIPFQVFVHTSILQNPGNGQNK